MKNKKTKVSELADHTGYWLRLISNNVSYAFARKLEDSDVTVAEWVVLREMYSGNNSTSPSSIAELTGLTRGAVSKLVSRLLEKRLVTRYESNKDRRYQDIELTAQARNLVPKLAKLADKNDEEFFRSLTKEEHFHLKELLMKLAGANQIKTVPID